MIWCSITADTKGEYVDPKIGSEGLGRVFIGPSKPFGMVRPGPDCTPSPNSGWLPMPERVDGFAQTHVSGTGGGPKYGNILIQPFSGNLDCVTHYAFRSDETIELGYYATTFEGSGITTEITAADKTAVYKFTYPKNSQPALMVDAGFFLGEAAIRDTREAQQFIGSEISIRGDNSVEGYSRIRGGWNNGDAYTVYFYLECDHPFEETFTFTKGPYSNQPPKLSSQKTQIDHGLKTGALLGFNPRIQTLNVRVGISFISEKRARENLERETGGKSFEELLSANRLEWEGYLNKINLGETTPDPIKRMFYTGLYHTMLMPSDRTGENPKWNDPGVACYDDFYAIWDTYRTSSPLLTLIAPQRQRDIVNSLINIGHREGFMPDARSGNSNGRTQGGSNADIVIADACMKGLSGIDYNFGLQQMLKDGEVDPGYRHEAEGRGGLKEYIELGYVPYGIPRAGNRTVEYSLCDFAIAQVARFLAANEPNEIRADSLRMVADKYDERSHNWTNLWREDAAQAGVKGFIMPKDNKGEWIDSIPFGHSALIDRKFSYHPNMFEGPWYTPWWNMFFYEAPSWEYSLSMPHDVDLLIEKCGGPLEFENRLDRFFDGGFYNVNNEPSFMSPVLYHWIGKPHRSSDRIREIISENFNAGVKGLPGNDDSGAMSSWLAWHILGLYPNAATDLYLILAPMVERWEMELENGEKFSVVAENFGDENPHVVQVLLNGRELPDHFLTHADIMRGGELTLKMGKVEKSRMKIEPHDYKVKDKMPLPEEFKGKPIKLRSVYSLHGQTRKFDMDFQSLKKGGMLVRWQIERNLKIWEGMYLISLEAMKSGNIIDYTMPEDGNYIALPDNSLFGMISRHQLKELKNGGTVINGVEFKLESPMNKESAQSGMAIKVVRGYDVREGTVIEVLDDETYPIIVQMKDNPLEINWQSVVYSE